MNTRRSLLLSLGSLPIACASAELHASPPVERPDWSRYFSGAEAVGSILVADERAGSASAYVHGLDRSRRRDTPASTFKIPHSLFALDAGLIEDEFQVIPWDRVKRPTEAWNADQILRSAMRNSVVWVYQRFANELGLKREVAYMQAIGYGNALTTGEAPFWVEGDLAISCTEQIAFLRRLYRNELPFRIEHQRLVKDLMIVEAGRNWILRAKSGWSGKIGRWVGWVEWPSGPVFFSLNIDTPRRLEDLPKREAITRAVLRSIQALPPEPA
jgi:beta-lactamase class D